MGERRMIKALGQVDADRWRGRVRFSNRLQSTTVLVFELDGDPVGVKAHCTHQGYDMFIRPLDDNGCLVCPRYGLGNSTKGADGFRISWEDSQFVMPWSLERMS
ncbi:MAG: hypothetical protein OQL20_11710 [Sedimenticola sp.]|nr:hypothetical protein [Sedimenticola sp.]